MTHNQHSHHQHTDTIYLGELYLHPADDHTLDSTATADAPTPPERSSFSFREVRSGFSELGVLFLKWVLGGSVLWVLMHLFG